MITIEQIVRVVEEETGKIVRPETEISELGLDSLDFVDLILQVSKKCGDIPDEVVPRINRVSDLYLAAMGTL